MIRLIKRQNRPQKPTFYFNFTSPLRAFGDCCCSHVNSSPKVYSSSRGHRTGSNNSGVEELVHHSGKTIMRTCEYTKHSSSAHHNCHIVHLKQDVSVLLYYTNDVVGFPVRGRQVSSIRTTEIARRHCLEPAQSKATTRAQLRRALFHFVEHLCGPPLKTEIFS